MTFEEWVYESEGINLRSEIIWDDVEPKDDKKLMEWLRAAYEIGYEACKQNEM